MKKRHIAALIALLASFIGISRSLGRAMRLELENRTPKALDVLIGTESAPDALAVQNLQPGEKRRIDLSCLPLLGHDAVYIRFPAEGKRSSYVRTLIYDIDEFQGQHAAAIVDYGQGLLDIRSVKR